MPYTIEHEDEATEVVILDDSGTMESCADVHVLFQPNGYVYISQEDDMGMNDLIVLSARMYEELIASYTKEEGFHNLVR